MTETLGARVRRFREARGLSLPELAERCRALGRRTDRRAIGCWEDDQFIPSVWNFGALARALQVEMEVLLYGEEEAGRLRRERDGA